MPRQANIERMKVITRYIEISELRSRNPFRLVSATIKAKRINISENGVPKIIAKWLKTSMLCCFFIVSNTVTAYFQDHGLKTRFWV